MKTEEVVLLPVYPGWCVSRVRADDTPPEVDVTGMENGEDDLSGHQNISQELAGTKTGQRSAGCGGGYRKDGGNYKRWGHKFEWKEVFRGVTNVA